MIKIISSAANLNFKWRKRTSERKQTKLHQNVAFIKDQKVVTKQGIFNTLLIHLLSMLQKYTEAFPLKKNQEIVKVLGFVLYFYINRFAHMYWEFCCKSLKLNCFEINDV